MMSLEDKQDNLKELKVLIKTFGGNSNIKDLQEGVDELQQCLRDVVENEKEIAFEDLKNMYFEDAFGDIHDAI